MSRATTSLGARSDLSASLVSFWANEAYSEVWAVDDSEAKEAIAVSSTTVNEDKITKPTDFEELLAISNTSNNNVLLDPINVDQLESFSNQSGIPTHYIEYSTFLELRPIPDSAYSLQLRYRKQFSELTETTSVPSVATRLRRAIMLKTKELLAENEIMDSNGAALARNAYISFMQTIPSDLALRNRSNRGMGLSLPRRRGQKMASSSASFDRDI